MKRVIAVANQKGGVGKTTTAVNLAASLTATKRRVLLIDLDPQGNATMGCGVDKHSQSRTSCDVLLGDCAAMEALVPVEYGGFMLMPSNQDLTAAEVRLLGMMTGREFKLRNALKPVREDFDVILIDCPPSLNMLTLNALVAADSVMVPMQCEYYALEGLSSLVQTIEQIRASINPDLEIEGLLRTMFDPRNNLANEVSAQLIEHFGEKVFRTMIPRNVRLAEAPSFGKPALFHDKESRGAMAYLALAGEMIRRDDLPPAPGIIDRCQAKSRLWVEVSPSSLPCSRSARARRSMSRRCLRRPTLAGDRLANLPLDLLQRGKFQPRVDMRTETLSELADSIKSQGLVQPILVRPVGGRNPGESQRYEIIAGERRWRAAQMAGLAEIPAVIRDVPDEAAVSMALIENIQREDLNPLEEAGALLRLIEEFGLTHQAAAEAVGRSRAAVSNLLRLMELADEVKELLEQRRIEMGHARALLGLNSRRQQIEVAGLVAKKSLSVRDTEAWCDAS